MIHGFLAVDKPKGMTSHDVLARLRRVLKQKKMGHTGTLDPNATGVLLVALGEATKLIPYLENYHKTYEAEILFGFSTDTCDVTGVVEKSLSSFELNPENLKQTLTAFEGPILQVPPIYSALKVNGKRLYDYARQGKDVEIKARPVTIDSIELIDEDLPKRVVVRVSCSKGTYIRSLARDIGSELSIPSCMGDLRRTAAGSANLSDCIQLEDVLKLEDDQVESFLLDHLLPLDRLFSSYPRLEILPKDQDKVSRGNALKRSSYDNSARLNEGQIFFFVTPTSRKLLAAGKVKADTLQPVRVFQHSIEEGRG